MPKYKFTDTTVVGDNIYFAGVANVEDDTEITALEEAGISEVDENEETPAEAKKRKQREALAKGREAAAAKRAALANGGTPKTE